MRTFMQGLIGLFLLSLVGCQAIPQIQYQEGESLKIRKYSQTSYKDVFQSVKSVLFAEEFSIKVLELEGGMIVATIAPETSQNFAIREADFYFTTYNKSKPVKQSLEITANIDALSADTISVQLRAQNTISYDNGSQDVRKIEAPRLYQDLFNKIQNEVKSRPSPVQKPSGKVKAKKTTR